MTETLEFRLLNDWQRDFPLTARPFAALAAACGVAESTVLSTLQDLAANRKISRIGPVFAPGRVGVSTLAAMAVPAARMQEVAALVNAQPEVNHNYERENPLNLWFVATAADEPALLAALDRISAATGLKVHDLRLEEEFRIDLGFDLRRGG